MAPATNPRRRSEMDAKTWHAQLARPLLSTSLDREGTLTLSRFRDIKAQIDQPSLTENVVAVHLGGAKRIMRWRGSFRDVFDVEEDSLTIVPAGEPYRWLTDGPIDFAHIVLTEDFLRRIAIEEFDRDPAGLHFRSAVGATDAVLKALSRALLADTQLSGSGELYRESLLVCLCVNLIGQHSSFGRRQTIPIGEQASSASKGGLAGWQLRRVVDYVNANLRAEISLAELVALTGLSRAQFFRAFGSSTGRSPRAYLTELRVERARELLRDTELPVGDVAQAVGLLPAQLSSHFVKKVGVSPGSYRREFGHATNAAQPAWEGRR